MERVRSFLNTIGDQTIRIDMPHDITYWSHEFRVSERTLTDAIEMVGPQAEDVFKFLQERNITGSHVDRYLDSPSALL